MHIYFVICQRLKVYELASEHLRTDWIRYATIIQTNLYYLDKPINKGIKNSDELNTNPLAFQFDHKKPTIKAPLWLA